MCNSCTAHKIMTTRITFLSPPDGLHHISSSVDLDSDFNKMEFSSENDMYIHELHECLKDKDKEIAELRQKLKEKEEQFPTCKSTKDSLSALHQTSKLDNPSIARFSRQLILPEFGVKGQVKLSNTSVLIVGAGGLGCPSAIYLAAAGVGRLGIVDYDEVELSNLHRQILHAEDRTGISKSSSVCFSCQKLNSGTEYVPYHNSLSSENALELIKNYDIVLDATDNVASRYLLNDACIMAKKPLVSGSALRFEGQLTVYNFQGGPCYRCLYPRPPPPETVTNCSDGGVLGAVPGLIGTLQALEAIKVATGIGTTYSQRLLLFDGLEGTFRTIKLRARRPECVVCGDSPTITKLIDYEEFCGARATDKDRELKVLGDQNRISVQEYKEVIDSSEDHLLIDVRQPVEMEICQLPNSHNISITDVSKEAKLKELRSIVEPKGKDYPVFVVCRKGNDSQVAVNVFREKLKDLGVNIRDIKGGLTAWSKHIDSSFPTY